MGKKANEEKRTYDFVDLEYNPVTLTSNVGMALQKYIKRYMLEYYAFNYVVLKIPMNEDSKIEVILALVEALRNAEYTVTILTALSNSQTEYNCYIKTEWPKFDKK